MGTILQKDADSLDGPGSICMEPIHYSLSTTMTLEWYIFLNGVTDSEEVAFLDLYTFLWCPFLSQKCVQETICVLPADTESNQNNSERAAQASARAATI
jgi:hypothetical protein